MLLTNAKGGGRNTALEAAKGDYVFFLDADDWWVSKEVLKTFGRLFKKGDYDFIDSRSHLALNCFCGANETADKDFEIDKLSASEYILKQYTNYVTTGCYKRSFILHYNLAFRENSFYEDIDWKFRAVISAESIGSIDFPFYGYFYNIESTTVNPSLFTFVQAVAIEEIMYQLIKGANITNEAKALRYSGSKDLPNRLFRFSRNFSISDSLKVLRSLKNYEVADWRSYENLAFIDIMKLMIIRKWPIVAVMPIRVATIIKRSLRKFVCLRR